MEQDDPEAFPAAWPAEGQGVNLFAKDSVCLSEDLGDDRWVKLFRLLHDDNGLLQKEPHGAPSCEVDHCVALSGGVIAHRRESNARWRALVHVRSRMLANLLAANAECRAPDRFPFNQRHE